MPARSTTVEQRMKVHWSVSWLHLPTRLIGLCFYASFRSCVYAFLVAWCDFIPGRHLRQRHLYRLLTALFIFRSDCFEFDTLCIWRVSRKNVWLTFKQIITGYYGRKALTLCDRIFGKPVEQPTLSHVG